MTKEEAKEEVLELYRSYISENNCPICGACDLAPDGCCTLHAEEMSKDLIAALEGKP